MYSPQKSYTSFDKKLNQYGFGTFCKFKISNRYNKEGVYALTVNNQVVYIGQSVNLSQRFNLGYGQISPRNCYEGGQSTNCKLNKFILLMSVMNKDIQLYFRGTNKTHDRMKLEKQLIEKYKPIMNSFIAVPMKEYTKEKEDFIISNFKNPITNDVRIYIKDKLNKMMNSGIKNVIIRSGDTHEEVKMNNAMPTVCSAMRSPGGEYKCEVIAEPPNGNGSRLIFNYSRME